MLTHSDIWRAIDQLALEYGLSPSGLARQSGLDPTTFNKSKRVSREGKLRWPSTESIAKILAATGAELAEFVSYAGSLPPAGDGHTIPILRLDQAAEDGHFSDTGQALGDAWDEIPFPDPGDAGVFALEVAGHAFEPVYRDGDIIVVSPRADVRRGDRVAVRARGTESVVNGIVVGVLRRQSAHNIDLGALDAGGGESSLPIENVDWMARIVWSSQ